MSHSKLAVCLDDLRLEAREAMERARSLGFSGIDVGATAGPISPQELSRTGQRHLLKHLLDLGLRLSSLRGPVGGVGYTDPATGERRLEAMRGVISLARSLQVPVVLTALGGGAAESDRVREVLLALADDADRSGVFVTVETAGIASGTLGKLLAELNCPYLAACCDSGAMLMQGENPHGIAVTLPGRVGHVRVRDAVVGSPAAPGHEVAIGQGQLDPERFLAGLAEAGFQGDLVLTRTTGGNAGEDLRRAQEVFAGLVR